MKLRKLLKDINVLNSREIKNVNIENISNKTTDDLTSGIYVCLKGEKVDGHKLKNEALKRGAVAFLVEEYDYDFDGMQILVDDTRDALSKLARNFYGNNLPKIIGITGTNGKTTTTNLVAHILKSAGKKVGLIGTEGVFYNNQKINLNMTTPDPIDLYKILADMKNVGVEYAVMEVSAHAIYLKKINALKFNIKALTNITEDHLDFFKDMKTYKQTKLDFMSLKNGLSIVNIDDKYGCGFASKNKNVFTYSLNIPADAMASNIANKGKIFDLVLNGAKMQITSNLIGSYNVQNIICAILICNKLGIKTNQIIFAVSSFVSVEGRLNEYKNGNKTIIIDFAHTPDALLNVLSTLKKEANSKLICVFGCGGNRDPQKRHIMGEIASKICDYVYVTSDNPRYEEPDFIANQIVSNIKTNNYCIIHNRKEAVIKAVSQLQDGDILALCGKGAENYIDIKGEKIPYSDREVVEALNFSRI